MHLEQFITRIQQSDGVEGLRGVMGQVTTEMGLGGFIYINRRIPKLLMCASEQTIIASASAKWTAPRIEPDPRWVEHVIVRAAADELPFFWGAPQPAAAAALELAPAPPLSAGAVASHGWTVPIHDAVGRVAALSFTGAQDFTAFCHEIEAHRATLHVMAIYFHAYVRRVLATQDRTSTAHLTPRELQCLGWAAQGKSRTDIGQIMGVSPRTIKFHLENAQRKLNVAHTTQAVLRAALLGLITITEEF
ncbi:MAG TPA: LuxR C-terminal-related transcriptional regulator [Kofleriaceae bacterium]|nr:LuxR C-terminal-related transcriptional regulator [Kofleriaceae bacterium]